MISKTKVYIAICSCRDWKPQFGASLCGMINAVHRSERIENIYLNSLQGTSVLPRARQLAIDDAIKGEFSHILMLDDDMKFPPDLLDSLLSREKPIIGVNYVRKQAGNATPMTCGMDGSVLSSKDKSGVEKVGWIGCGAVLLDLSVIRYYEKPLFEMRWMPERNDFIGEDYYFCMKAHQYGTEIHIDHDVSNKCAHIGDFAYKEV